MSTTKNPEQSASMTADRELPAGKQTTPGLYVTAAQAYEKWKAAPDKVKDPDSVFHGKRMRNGWKNSVPWVYDIDPEKIILEEYASKQTQ